MKFARAATTAHKWLALLMAAQMLFWFASGLFFALVPIDMVRSEHRLIAAKAAPMAVAEVAERLSRIGRADAAAERVEVGTLLGRQVAVLRSGEARPRLYDLATGTKVSPISGAMAGDIARRDSAAGQSPAALTAVYSHSPEYRGALPAWRVGFDDGYAVYVAADTGAVTARRSTVWRIYDWLWALHILDLGEHEDFNTPLLAGAAALGLVIVLSGIVMLPVRLRKKTGQRRAGREDGGRQTG